MKQLTVFVVVFFFLTAPVFASNNPPRQKVLLSGATAPNSPKAFTVKDFENFNKSSEELTFFDPYNKNIETLFYGFYLKDFAKKFASSDYKTLRVSAIDGYKVDVPRASIEKDNLFFSYKDKAGYLTVDRMGPARIIAPAKGIIDKDLLLKIGVYWVWQVKTLEFIR